jgi:hypothetical protein
MVPAWLEMGPAAALLVITGAWIINTVAKCLLFPHLAGTLFSPPVFRALRKADDEARLT